MMMMMMMIPVKVSVCYMRFSTAAGKVDGSAQHASLCS